MEIGKQATKETMVDETNVARNLASGDVDVFATPSMIALMEYTAAQCLAQFLEPEQTSVGTVVNVAHTAATPIGMQVRAHAEITGFEGKVVQFKVWAEDECGPIGEGVHTRAIVNREKFIQRANAKRTNG